MGKHQHQLSFVFHTEKCVQRSKEMKEQIPINLLFDTSKKQTAPQTNTENKRLNLGRETPCLGISDQTWKRPRAKTSHPILNRIISSPSILHGAPPRHNVCNDLFGSASEVSLLPNQKAELEAELKARATWRIERQGTIKAIFSTSCQLVIPQTYKYGELVVLCESCNKVRSDRTLISAINADYAEVT